MIDRLSAKYITLPDGRTALRYGDYDANGNLLGYKYLAPEDEPIEPGTKINKATLFTDTTAAAYDLTGEGATPNNALAALAPFTQYTWARQRKPTTEYSLEKGATANKIAWQNTTSTGSANVYYTDSITFDANGNAIAGASGYVSGNYNNYTFVNAVKGKYWSRTSSFTQGAVINPAHFKDSYEINYTEPNAPNAAPSGAYSILIQGSRVIPSSITTTYDPERLSSANPNAYPHSDTSDYFYRFFNRFSDLPLAFMESSVVTGTYTGDGAATRNIALDGTFSAILVSSLFTSNTAINAGNFSFATQLAPGWAVTLTPTGFTVYNVTGTNPKYTNTLNGQYFFIAWR